MMLLGEEYRFVAIENPPFPYGIGLDSPDKDFWIIPPYIDKPAKVFVRDKLPAPAEENQWVEIPYPEQGEPEPLLPLFLFAEMLAGEMFPYREFNNFICPSCKMTFIPSHYAIPHPTLKGCELTVCRECWQQYVDGGQE